MSANTNISLSVKAVSPIGLTLNYSKGSAFIQLSPPSATNLALYFADIGPRGPAGTGGGASTFTSENKDSVTLSKGTPVTQDASGTGIRRADVSVNAGFCVGIAQADIPSLSSGVVQTDGILVLADWTPIIGATSLSPKTKYYLDAAGGGKLTANPPSTTGYLLQKVGVAVDPQTLEINLSDSILL